MVIEVFIFQSPTVDVQSQFPVSAPLSHLKMTRHFFL